MDVRAKIKFYLEERGISQAFICEKTGIQNAKLSFALNGKRKLTIEEYQCICWALGVGVDQFMSPLSPAEIGA